MQKRDLVLSLAFSLAQSAFANPGEFCKALVQKMGEDKTLERVRIELKNEKLNPNIVLGEGFYQMYTGVSSTPKLFRERYCLSNYRRHFSNLEVVQAEAPENDGNADAVTSTFAKRRPSSVLGNRNSMKTRGTSERSYCEKLEDEEACINPTVKTKVESLNKIADIVGAERQCSCLENLIMYQYAGRNAALREQRQELEEKLQADAYRGFGKKFLNSFAMSVEDVNFFGMNSSFFGGDPKTQDKNASRFQCAEAPVYEQAITEKCGKTLSIQDRQKRLDSIFGVFGDQSSGDLNAKLKSAMKNIMYLDGTTLNNKGTPYSRTDHDLARYSLVATDKQYGLMDRLLKEFLLNPQIKKQVSESSGSLQDVVGTIILEESRKDPENFIKRYLKESELGQEVYKSYVDSVRGSGFDNNRFKLGIAAAMGLHPGMRAMLQNKTTLFEVVDRAGKTNQSLTAVLQNSSSPMAKKFVEDCSKLVKSLAEVVCLPPETLVKKIGKEDVKKILKPEDQEVNLSSLMECSAVATSEYPFENMTNIEASEALSDFYDRMMNPREKQSNSFSRTLALLEKHDPKYTNLIQESLQKTDFRNRLQASSLASNMFGQNSTEESALASVVGIDPKRLLSPQRAKDVPSESEMTAATQSAPGGRLPSAGTAQMAQAPAPATPSFQPMTAAPAPLAEARPQTDLKKEFKQFLANETNRDQVEKHLSNADDSMMKDLQKLREDLERNQQKLSELSAENERNKLKNLKDQIERLEGHRDRLSRKEEFENDERGDEDSNFGRSPGNPLAQQPRRDIASLSNFADAGSASAGASSGDSRAIGSGGERATLSELSKATQAAFAQSGKSDAGVAPLVISSDTARNSVPELQSLEVSSEILSYLEKASPDVNALLQLKNSGMVYRYKVVENGKVIEKQMLIDYKSLNDNVKKVIEQKIAAKGIDVNQLEKIDGVINRLKRSYTFNSLKLILTEQMKK